MDTLDNIPIRQDAGKGRSTQVNFVCQKCYQPLKLDHSFAALNEQIYSELTAPLTRINTETLNILPIPEQKDPEDPNISRKYVPASRVVSSESGNGFTLLGESEPSSVENLSHQLKVTSQLFDVLSSESDVDHPLCEECTDALLDMLDQELKLTEDECKDYKEFLEELESSKEEIDESVLNGELKQLEAEEATLKEQLNSIEAERTQVLEQIEKEKEKAQQLDKDEINFYKEYNDYKRQLLEYEDAQKSVDNQLKYAKNQLGKLINTNVFNATFHIWHSGHFGTINNFRLGRLPNVPVDWNEINAAWGQTVLLLHSLANKRNLRFQRYRLVPYGNHSYLESLTDKSKELPLYGSGGIRFFWDTKFDAAMVAFLDCLQQFKEEIEKGNTGFCLPYKMEKGRIEDSSTGTSYSIKIQFNSEEQWTKALKFMLTNLRWGLAWVSAQFASSKSEID